MSKRLRPKGLNDQGAILVIAIIIVTVVALVTGFVLTRGEGSLRATVNLREVAGTSYAADGAAQIAINGLRTGYWAGTDTKPTGWAFNNAADYTGCYGRNSGDIPVDSMTLNNLYPTTGHQSAKTSAIVVCEPEDATGARGSAVPITTANKPGMAILALGVNTLEKGISVKPQSSTVEQFRVQGGIWSNSNIESTIGALRSTESIHANTGCDPLADMEAPVVDCDDAGIKEDPEVDEPYKFSHDATAGAPAYQAVPGTSACDGIVEFEPGYYDDAKALSNITDSTVNACKNSTFWFKPGTYYFDFHNRATDHMSDSDIFPSGESEWVVGEGDLVAGTPAASVNLGALTNESFPGTCVNPIDNIDNDGVQFIFGGESRIRVDDGANVEICGTYHEDRTPIAVYALKSGTASQTLLSEAVADQGDPLTTSGTPDVDTGTFAGATATALKDQGNGSATWARSLTDTGPATKNGKIALHGFAPGSSIPKGSVLTSATLRVRHKDGTTASSVKITPTVGVGINAFDLPLRSATIETDPVLLTGKAGWGAFQDAVHDNGLAGLDIEFTGKLKKGESAELDFVRLELTYFVPQLRGQNDAGIGGGDNCLANINSCAVISTPTAYKDRFYIQGTTYAPISRIDLNLNQATAQVMRFGIIVRSLAARTTGGFAYEGNVIELPDNSPGFGFKGTIVQLTVYVCQDRATGCTTALGKKALTSRVQIWDETGVPLPSKRDVSVMSWSHQR